MRSIKKVIVYTLAQEEGHFMDFVCARFDPAHHIYYEAALASFEMGSEFDFNGTKISSEEQFDDAIERFKNACI